jgi:hypothetical protein
MKREGRAGLMQHPEEEKAIAMKKTRKGLSGSL